MSEVNYEFTGIKEAICKEYGKISSDVDAAISQAGHDLSESIKAIENEYEQRTQERIKKAGHDFSERVNEVAAFIEQLSEELTETKANLNKTKIAIDKLSQDIEDLSETSEELTVLESFNKTILSKALRLNFEDLPKFIDETLDLLDALIGSCDEQSSSIDYYRALKTHTLAVKIDLHLESSVN